MKFSRIEIRSVSLESCIMPWLQDHKHILLSCRCLDDKLVDASQKILAKQFENKFTGSGFQDAAVGTSVKLAQYSTEHSLTKNLRHFLFSDLNQLGIIRKRRNSALFLYNQILKKIKFH